MSSRNGDQDIFYRNVIENNLEKIIKAFIKKYKYGSSHKILCCKKGLRLKRVDEKPQDKEELDKDMNWFNQIQHDKPLNNEIRTDLKKRGFEIDQSYEKQIEANQMTKEGIRK